MVVPNRLTQADGIVTPSHHTRGDLIKYLGVHPERVSVIYPGIDHELFVPAETLGKKNNSKPYLLSVAGKRYDQKLRKFNSAFSSLPSQIRKEIDLLLVGDLRKREDLARLVQEVGCAQHIQFTGRVSDLQLVKLYQGAWAFIFPSLYEGFGFPVLEAMACGCPVLVSNRSSLPEIVQNSGLLFDPTDQEELIEGLLKIILDSRLRSSLCEKGVQQAARFSWKGTASNFELLYDKIGTGLEAQA